MIQNQNNATGKFTLRTILGSLSNADETAPPPRFSLQEE